MNLENEWERFSFGRKSVLSAQASYSQTHKNRHKVTDKILNKLSIVDLCFLVGIKKSYF